jgi:hypothetical protein
VSGTRTRTRSEVKWLANELAATAGELERIDEELARLRARRRHLQSVHAALAAVAGLVAVPELPGVVPGVRTHEAWGGRGNLRNYFRAVLKAAYPGAVDTLALTNGAAQHFGLSFSTSMDRNRFRRVNVTKTLRKLVGRGEVERLHDPVAAPNSVGAWRWKVDAPTLADLHRLQEED